MSGREIVQGVRSWIGPRWWAALAGDAWKYAAAFAIGRTMKVSFSPWTHWGVVWCGAFAGFYVLAVIWAGDTAAIRLRTGRK